jgi:carbon monoxide dehydrogenase subunit G
MRVEGTRSFAAPRETVWGVLNSPEKMAELMPGVEGFDVQDDRNWSAKVKVPLGLGGLRMSIKFEKTDERELEFSRLHAKGTGVGALMDMDTSFHLSDEGAGTAMRWEADVKIAGPVGSMGQRVLQPIVNQQVRSVLDALDRQVTAATGGAEMPAQASGSGGDAGTPEPTTDAPAQTDPELKDYGPPAEGVADPEGSSGAEEGISRLADEGYSDDPQGPTQN